ncbi:MAG TPA: hypothetical protein VJ652_15945 [Noviherbaspirillum sp.]|nr:hypothetical protein [Noviherbaspirillum sp.]
MRHLLLPALFLASASVSAAPGDFSGVWTALVCPSGIKNDPGQCTHFILELYQRQDKLCGSHLFATPGSIQMDERTGAGPTLTGTIADDTATVTVADQRARSAQSVRAELKLARGGLQWHRVDKPGKNDVLPVNVRFAKSRAKTLLNPVFAQQLSAACTMLSPQPAEPEGVPAVTPPHQRLHPGQRTGLAENSRDF